VCSSDLTKTIALITRPVYNAGRCETLIFLRRGVIVMNVSFGEQLVNFEIRELRRKLAGVGGKNLGPSERVREINKTIEEIHRIHRDQPKDVFFRTQKFKETMQWLENLLKPSLIASN
jgi:hypothetical protein